MKELKIGRLDLWRRSTYKYQLMYLLGKTRTTSIFYIVLSNRRFVQCKLLKASAKPWQHFNAYPTYQNIAWHHMLHTLRHHIAHHVGYCWPAPSQHIFIIMIQNCFDMLRWHVAVVWPRPNNWLFRKWRLARWSKLYQRGLFSLKLLPFFFALSNKKANLLVMQTPQ